MVIKRTFDVVIAVTVLAVTWPCFLLVALLIKLEDGGPVFFRQTRVGLGGKLFRICKFRTMVNDAENKGLLLTVGDDIRVTRVGRLLRRYKVDEVPQFLNVLRGEMSLVGPRPEVSKYAECFNGQARRILSLVPGMTDPAALEYADEAAILGAASEPEKVYLQDVLPRKVQISLEYARHADVWADCGVILRTLTRLAAGRRPKAGLPRRVGNA